MICNQIYLRLLIVNQDSKFRIAGLKSKIRNIIKATLKTYCSKSYIIYQKVYSKANRG